jgi:hypothetical protein
MIEAIKDAAMLDPMIIKTEYRERREREIGFCPTRNGMKKYSAK